MSRLHAQPIRHAYSSGQEFYLVVCETCQVVLNSAHHYPPSRDDHGREEPGRPCQAAVDCALRHEMECHPED